MADYHILDGLPDGNAFRLVRHVPIPGAGSNRAGVQWRTALITSGIGGKTILLDGDGTRGTISSTEKAQILAGAVFESVEEIATNPGETAGQLATRMNTLHSIRVTEIQNQLQNRLTYFGYIRI